MVNLASESADTILKASPSPGIKGTLGVGHGGTGITTNPSLQVSLASTSAASVFASAPRPGVSGILSISNGGTGINSFGLLKTGSELATSLATATLKAMNSLSLEAGTWLITATAWWASNATGRRGAKISTTKDTDVAGGDGHEMIMAVSGSTTGVNVVKIVTPSSTTTYYLNMYQTSGSTLNTGTAMHALRIK